MSEFKTTGTPDVRTVACLEAVVTLLQRIAASLEALERSAPRSQ